MTNFDFVVKKLNDLTEDTERQIVKTISNAQVEATNRGALGGARELIQNQEILVNGFREALQPMAHFVIDMGANQDDGVLDTWLAITSKSAHMLIEKKRVTLFGNPSFDREADQRFENDAPKLRAKLDRVIQGVIADTRNRVVGHRVIPEASGLAHHADDDELKKPSFIKNMEWLLNYGWKHKGKVAIVTLLAVGTFFTPVYDWIIEPLVTVVRGKKVECAFAATSSRLRVAKGTGEFHIEFFAGNVHKNLGNGGEPALSLDTAPVNVRHPGFSFCTRRDPNVEHKCEDGGWEKTNSMFIDKDSSLLVKLRSNVTLRGLVKNKNLSSDLPESFLIGLPVAVSVTEYGLFRKFPKTLTNCGVFLIRN